MKSKIVLLLIYVIIISAPSCMQYKINTSVIDIKPSKEIDIFLLNQIDSVFSKNTNCKRFKKKITSTFDSTFEIFTVKVQSKCGPVRLFLYNKQLKLIRVIEDYGIIY
jgi:hypothetical protein